MNLQCKHRWHTTNTKGQLICFDCGEPVAVAAEPRLIKIGDVVILKKYNVCGPRTVKTVDEWGIVFSDGGSVRFRDFERFGLEHVDGTPVLRPDTGLDAVKEAIAPASKPAWKVWREHNTRKGECPCGIPEGVCNYHRKSA